MMAGTAVLTLSGLGTAPVSSPVWVASQIGLFSFGTWTFIINIAFVAAQWAIARFVFHRNFFLAGLIQIPALILASSSIDLWMWLLGWIVSDIYLIQLTNLVVGTLVLAMGIAVLVNARLIYLPGEGFVASLAEALGKPFSRVKVAMDIICVTIAVFLAGLVLGNWFMLREATLISAVTLGPLVGFFTPWAARVVNPQK